MGARKKSHNGPKPRPPSMNVTDLPKSEQPIEDDLAYLEMSHANAKDFEPYDPVQRDMYFVVYSMYHDGFERIRGRKGPWQKHDNLAFSVLISSNLSKDCYAKMEFEIPFQYPKFPVKAKLLELRPRTKQLEADITKELSTYPAGNLHEAVITEMIMKAQDLIDQEATDHEFETQGMSLEAERAYQAAVARDHAKAQREHELREREKEEMARTQRLQEALLKEKQRRHGQYAPQEGEDMDPGAEDDVSEIPFRFKDPVKWYDPWEKKTLIFAAVFGPRVLLSRPDKKVTLVHPVRFGKLQFPVFILKEIFLPDYLATKEEMESSMDSIRKTLEDCKTTTHPHIAQMFAYQIEHDVSDRELPEWKITILTEQASESGLQAGLLMSYCFKAIRVRLWMEQILQAMDFLDKLGHPHPAIHLGNIFFWRKSREELVVKITDGYGIPLRKLVDKVRNKDASAIQTPSGWTPPELTDGGEGQSSKTAVWQVGIVLLKMAFSNGLKLEEVHTSVDALLMRDDLQEAFKSFLRAVFNPIPRKRPSPLELLSHRMLKEGTQGFNIPTKENLTEEPHLLRSGDLATQNSQWMNLFMEKGLLGEGGFGQVFKARYMVDHMFYAVKRLVCESREDVQAIWDEVRFLARLNHPGVVRYHNAWQEDEQIEDRFLERITMPVPSKAHSVVNHLYDTSTRPVEEHDFMDPSLHQYIGAEYNSDDDQFTKGNNNKANDDDEEEDESSEDDDGSGNMFAYQVPAQDSDENEEVFTDDPFSNSGSFDQHIPQSFDDFSDNIQFGDDTSSAPNEREVTPEARTPSPVRRTPAKSSVKRSVLYIQMELCQTGTLRDAIIDGLPYRITDVWAIFRDILEALAHIHNNNVVHRDLKPNNIFIDNAGRAKIGDFGLAITSTIRISGKGNKNMIAGSEKGVGTQWYVAPELDNDGSGEYSSKADMFSLGVIFFQMCMPMTTEFERQGYLNQISKNPNFELPPFFDNENHREQGRIIKSLLNHDQNARPTSVELLTDPAIPENLGDATITRHLTRMIIQDPEKYAEFINKLYLRASNFGPPQAIAWSNRGQASEKTRGMKATTSTAVNDQLREIFRRHGAVESDRNIPFPVLDCYSNAVTFMDDDVLVQLPFDLTAPYAHMLADPDDRPENPKSFCFGTVYRRAHRGIAPTALPEVDYDHVSYSARDLSLKDAETIKVLDEVLTEHKALAPRTFTIIINHGDLLDSVLKFARIDEEEWNNVKRVLSQLNVRRIDWRNVRDQLLDARYEISQSSVSCLEKFNLQGDVDMVKKRVNLLFDEELASRTTRTFARLEEIQRYLDMLGVVTSVQVAPLSNNTEQLYRGSLMFKAIENKSRKILAVGGRYDRLIEAACYNEPVETVVRAVGFRINVSVLGAYAVAEEKKRSAGKHSTKDSHAPPSRVDVVVTSFDEATLHGTCLEICKNLLTCGVRVEVSELYNNMAELDQYYDDPNILLIIVRPGPRIKVRNAAKDEADVRPSELVTYVKTELGDRNPVVASEQKLRRTGSSHAGEKPGQRVSVCAPSHKDKKANRLAIVDSAETAAQEMAEEIRSNAPIVAISTKDEVLELIRNTRLTDDSSWRTLRQSVSATERQYLVTVQELLQQKADEGARGAFVVNYRTNFCIFYDLGKKA